MKTCHKLQKRFRRSDRRGAVAVYSAIILVVMIGILAFGIEVGRMALERTRLQHAVDSAALAAANELITAQTPADVKTAIDYYLTANGFNASTLASDELIITYGYWDEDTREFVESSFETATAVNIECLLPDQRLFFGGFLGRSTFDSSAEAIASVGAGAPQDVMMVIDCSTSMSDNNRMSLTTQAGVNLIDELRFDDRVGLAVYSWPDPTDNNRKTGFLETSLAFDHSPTRNLVPSLTPGRYSSGTNIAGGMRAGLDELRINERIDPEFEPMKVMVVLTDGRANISEPPGFDEWDSINHFALVAEQENVIIHTITLGSDASQTAMQNAASTTGGLYKHVNDGDLGTLQDFFRRIGRGIGRPQLVD